MQSTNPYNTPESTASPAGTPGGLRSLRIKRVDPVSMAKLLGAMYAIIGLIVGAFMSLFGVIGMFAGGGGGEAVAGGAIMAIGSIIMMPVFYGIGGFIAGFFSGLFYNFVAGLVGGIIMDVEV